MTLMEMLAHEDVPALRARLVTLGASYHHKEGKDKLIARIVELSATTQPDQKTKPADAPKVIQKPVKLTEEEIREALAPFIQRGLKLSFAGDSWNIRFDTGRFAKDVGGYAPIYRQDSGHLTVPLSAVRKCAELVMRNDSAPVEGTA